MTEFVRTYHIPRQEVCDFRAHLNMKLFQMPQSYRPNSSGAYTVIKNGAVDWVRKYQKWAYVEWAFVEPGPDDDADEDDAYREREIPFNVGTEIKDKINWADQFGRQRLAEQTVLLMQSLPDPERICLTFHFGIGTARPLSLYLIARKLGVTTDWVKRRLARGQFLMRKRLEGSSLINER